jgi:hypothetical protein
MVTARWLDAQRSEPAAFVLVIVHPAAPAALQPVLFPPGAYRVEALDVEQLAPPPPWAA